MKRPTKRKRRVSTDRKGVNGRPPFRATAKQRIEVECLAQVGYSEDFIAEFVGVAPKTLRKHFRHQLDHAKPRLIGLAVGVIAKAIAGFSADRKAALTAAFFVMKTQAKDMGWVERAEVTGKDGKPLIDLTKLSDDELDLYERLIRKAGAALAATAANVHQEHETPQ